MELKKYLPIGSVVELKNSKNKFMIMGYLIKKDKMVYDYASCLFPEGILSLNDLLVFNNEKVEKILFKGYESTNYDEFNKLLNDLYNYNLVVMEE